MTPIASQPFYRAFEDRYRGARATIKDRLRAYLPFIAPLLAQAAPGSRPTALDLGCGRGEWLELLGEQGFAARGIDLDEGMLAACHERGLDVELADALRALRAQPDHSLAVVSAFHLVEHIPFDLVRELASEALRALQPGGLLIMETPNPENLTVGATSFYMDPSHLHPLPPNLLAFAAEHAGFARQQIVRLQEDPQLHTAAPVGLITVLEGPSPDYSIVAQKAAPAALLAAFDASFAASYGVALGALAQRYDAQAARQHAEVHAIFARQMAEIGAAHSALARQEEALAALRADSARLELRLAQNEAYAAAMSQRVVDLLDSTSWRITAPLRWLMAWPRRLQSARREGRLGSGLKRRLKDAVLGLARAVLRRPRIKRLARAVLQHLPGLQARMQGLLYQAAAESARAAAAEVHGELSPRATRAYHELKKAYQTRKN
ncbi:bifunctional 2-polyprenyl-6-hydroxyphenol methylase/3-demethylubiquinol 3-O-methyltransferase UbiG [Massilia sp. YIM B04103]|uniref:class I SAM-dependent methyltransferase n=1 Tax=Massilia sp. YIM B04103 TaxID=2963106 RepID=UPI00210CC870|nr:class I SAM-dependent methyltransferase [Massilia sp. YIM B04103]